jgi:aminoglycoside phosphotransferase (APT) family kinase protein
VSIDVREGLARYLAEQWSTPVEIPFLRETSAGARRRNLLFDAHDGTKVHPLVVTIIPNPVNQLLSVSDEAGLILAAEAGGVTVPHVHFCSEDAGYVGGPFFITQRVEGETATRRVLRLVEQVGHGAKIGRQLGQAFASLHAIDADAVPNALARPSGMSPSDVAINVVSTQVADLLQPSPAFSLAVSWLERCQPRAPAKLAPIHGDVRNGNIVVSESGLQAILDWELAHVGDPMEDLATLCLRTWRFGHDQLEAGGFCERATVVGSYESAGGSFDLEAFHWWKVLGTLRWGLGLAAQAKGHLDGSVPNIVMAASGRRVAELEFDVLNLLGPL